MDVAHHQVTPHEVQEKCRPQVLFLLLSGRSPSDRCRKFSLAAQLKGGAFSGSHPPSSRARHCCHYSWTTPRVPCSGVGRHGKRQEFLLFRAVEVPGSM